MRLFWQLAEQSEGLKHVVFVLCNSHSYQFIIKDFCEFSFFRSVLAAAQAIARGFHKAKKQYAILREIQEEVYQTQKALILSVITRWGTQYALCISLINNREALQRWALRVDIEISGKEQPQKKSILSDDFWAKLNKLCIAVKPIHEL